MSIGIDRHLRNFRGDMRRASQGLRSCRRVAGVAVLLAMALAGCAVNETRASDQSDLTERRDPDVGTADISPDGPPIDVGDGDTTSDASDADAARLRDVGADAETDGGERDLGVLDAPPGDAPTSDAPLPDTRPPDAGDPDTGTPPDAGPECSSADPASCGDGMACIDGSCVARPGRLDAPFKGIQPDFHEIDDIAGNGAGHVAMNVVWALWQPERHAAPCPDGWEAWDGTCFVVDAAIDEQIRNYSERGVSVTGILYGSPAWARSGRSGCPTWGGAGTAWFCAPDDPSHFARFAAYIAARYDGLPSRSSGQVDDFVIWNEVNADDWFSLGGWPNSGNMSARIDEHSRLYWQASDAIRAVRPAARVYVSLTHLFGSATGAHFSGYRVLQAVEDASAGRPWHVALHPYSEAVGGQSFDAWDAPHITFGNIHELTGWLHALRPDEPPTVFITEVGFNSIGSESGQAEAVCLAYRQALATPGVTGFIYHRYADHPFEVAAGVALGLAAPDGRQKPAWSTWALMDREVAGTDLECGFEHLPWLRVSRWRNGSGQYWVTPRDPLGGGYARETTEWLLSREERSGTVLLYDCVVPGGEDHFVSRDPGCEGQQPMGPIGWAWTEPGEDRVPMHRCYNPGVAHFVSPDPGCESPAIVHESLLGYGRR